MKSIRKNKHAFDHDSLYVFLIDNQQVNVETFDLKTLSTIGKLSIKSSYNNIVEPIIDENHIYFVDQSANLIFADKFSGQVLNRVELKSIAVALQQYDSSLYLLSLLPLRTSSIFSAFFLQKINKSTMSSMKFMYNPGVPINKLIVDQDILFCSSRELYCYDFEGRKKWINSLSGKPNNFMSNSQFIMTYNFDGAAQVFHRGGQSAINIQFKTSRIRPTLQDGSVWWFESDSYRKVDFKNAISQKPKWHETVKTDKIKFGTVIGEDVFLQNETGDLKINDQKFAHFEETIQKINKPYSLMCETEKRISFERND